MNRNSKTAEARADLGLARRESQRPQIPHSGVKALPGDASAERLLGGPKWSDVSLLMGLCAAIPLG